jgi:hypothetical protein
VEPKLRRLNEWIKEWRDNSPLDIKINHAVGRISPDGVFSWQVACLEGMLLGMEHHVYFWLKDERNNESDRVVFEKGMADLFGIDVVAGGIWGSSAPTPERPVTDKSFDYALSMEFESVAKHDAYQVHPDHDVFVNTFKDWWKKVLIMDVDG